MLYKSEQRLLKVYTYKHTYTTRHTHMGNVNRAVSSFPIFPGSAAGAAALIYLILIGTFRPSPSFTILHHSWGAKSWGFHVPTSITMGWSTPPPPQGPPSTPRERPSSRSSRSSRPSRPSRSWVKTVERSRRTKKHSFRVWMMQMILKPSSCIRSVHFHPHFHQIPNPSSNPNDPKIRR